MSAPHAPLTAPLVHLNGSSAQALMDSYRTAWGALRQAIECLQDTAPNARDYYPRGDESFAAAKREHDARVGQLREVSDQLHTLYDLIDQQMSARAGST